jgi:hypothetical protein
MLETQIFRGASETNLRLRHGIFSNHVHGSRAGGNNYYPGIGATVPEALR